MQRERERERERELRILASIYNPVEILSKASLYLSAFIVYPLIVGIIIFDVGGRFLFNSPLSWGTEGSGLLLIMAIFLACTAVDAANAHIRLDIFYANFSERGKRLVNIVTNLVAGWWVWLLSRQSYREIFNSIDMMESGMDVTVPFWPIRVVMTFAFVLLGVHLALSLFINIATLIRGGDHA